MRLLPAFTCSLALLAGCGGGASGPTAPAPPANVAGSWAGTVTTTLTAGPACLGRQPDTYQVTAQITQSGGAISGTSNLTGTPCSFHGTVSGTTISWTEDDQQASFLCRVGVPHVCFANGGITLLDIGGQTSSISGSVSGAQINAAGSSTSDIHDPTTGHVIGTVQASLQLTLQRQ